MDCGICMAYLRKTNRCPGCRVETLDKRKTCLECKIKNCINLSKGDLSFCFECKDYPCDKLKHLDLRYRTKYGMSMIANLNKIKEVGLTDFMKIENTRWVCPNCGNPICVHNKKCYFCEE
jgi:hypothetical protein